MAVPKKRTSAARRDKRRSHHGLKPMYGIVCPECGANVLPHRICNSCGHYMGKQYLPDKSA